MMINSQIDSLVRKAKLKLFTNTLFFFGMMANKFTWDFEDLPEDMEGFVKFNLDNPDKLESGIIHINRNYLLNQDYTYINLIFILCHELLHILNKHGLRSGDRDWVKWNIACDHVIEVFLRNMKDVIKPYKEQYNIIDELYNEKRNCTAEYAYDWIVNNPNKVQIVPNGDITVNVKTNNGNEEYTVILNLGGVSSPMDEDENAKAVLTDQIVAEARAIFENIKSKGNSSGQLVSYLDEILKVEIPWETLVEKAIKTNVIMKPDERTWRCLNKFFSPHKITLPGYSFMEDTEGTGTLIITVDSSGSVSDKELKKFSSVIENSMRYFKVIKLLVHDTRIHQRQEFTKDNIYDFYKFIKETGYKGRGGTSHKSVFQEIQTEFWEKDKDDLSMVMSLTDMYSDIEHEYKKYKWIKNNIPLVFIITRSGKTINFDSDFGSITQIVIN